MALSTSIIITAIAVALLLIYGADVAIGGETGEGFLGSDHVVRGIGLGVPSIVLPIAAFFISRKEPSKTLGIMIIVTGILIIIGGAFVLAITDFAEMEAQERPVAAESGGLIVVGAFIVALGTIKLKQS